jgi:CDGSH-type Zn-finger protein
MAVSTSCDVKSSTSGTFAGTAPTCTCSLGSSNKPYCDWPGSEIVLAANDLHYKVLAFS